jgi:AcrR family transcriptional regulator
MSTREERRAQLLEVAREVVLRHGYRKANLGDVAREAGVSRATVYNYFSSKEILLRAIVAQEVARINTAVAAELDLGAPPHRQLLSYVAARARHIRAVKELYDLAHNVTRDVLHIVQAEIEDQQAQERAYLTALIGAGIDAGLFCELDRALLGAALQSALRGLYEDYVFDSQEATAQGAELLVRTLLSGMLREPASASLLAFDAVEGP